MAGRSRRGKKAYKREHPRQATGACGADSELPQLLQALQSANRINRKLSSINTNLRKQVKEFKRLEISWVKQKDKLKHENSCIRRIFERKYAHARNEINRLEDALNAAESNEEQTDRIRESQQEIEALRERLESLQEKMNQQLNINYENNLNEVRSDRDNRGSHGEEKTKIDIKEITDKCQRQQEEIIKKENLITGFLMERLALMNALLQTAMLIYDKDNAHDQSERQWKLKCEDLEVRLREEQAKREKGKKSQPQKRRKTKAADIHSEHSMSDEASASTTA